MTELVIRGAREHNLAGVDLDLPRGRLIVLTGVSGSGKSSLAFDTLHAEGTRRYLEALAPNVRRLVGKLARPDVDVVLGLPPTVALDQRPGAVSSRSSVASLADVLPILRVLYARAGAQHCPTCDALIRPHTHDQIAARLLRFPSGTRLLLEAPVRVREGGLARVVDEVARAGFSRVRLDGEMIRVEEIDPRRVATDVRVVVDRLRLEADKRDRLYDAIRTTTKAGRGVMIASLDDEELRFTDRPYCPSCDRALPALEPSLLSPNASGACAQCRGSGQDAATERACAACAGTRLSDEARAIRWPAEGGRSLPELLALSIGDLAELVRAMPRGPIDEVPLDELAKRLATLVEVGLEHLPLERRAQDVSSGELQRVRLARQIGAGLSGVLYVLDEPSAGLHPHDVTRVVQLILRLRDAGNTVLVVDHHADMVAAADRVIDFGPGPGARGGQVVFEGSYPDLLKADTLTGRWLSGRDRLPTAPPAPIERVVRARGVFHRNLRDFDVDLPLDSLVAITGPSGSGKTALLEVLQGYLDARLQGAKGQLPRARALDGLEAIERLVQVDRGALGRTARSNPATYSGMWDVMRDLLASTREARVRGLEPSFFSLNVKGGRCEACQGTGFEKVDLGLLPDVYLRCEACQGRRFSADVLEVTWKGRSPDQLLDLSAEEALALLAGHPRLETVLRAVVDVGLGYIQLGQPAHTLSGGEAQRLRLARELTRSSRSGGRGTLYLIDDPTVGLHPADVDVLLRLFRRLVSEGATVWMATHYLPLAAAADHRVELSPGAVDSPVDNSASASAGY